MGQHSKNTNRISTGAKVALSGLAITASGIAVAPSASAAPDSDWDRLAQCESGGNWGINTGNGFQGGLQFAPSTWSAYGGTEYAATANQATREQQITVGERVLAEQGWTAWPACSAQLGLSSAPSQRDNAYANGAQAAVQPAAAPVEEAAPTENAAPAAQAPAEAADEAPTPQKAVTDLAATQSIASLDQIFDTIQAAFNKAGIPMPAVITDYYHAHHDELVGAYNQAIGAAVNGYAEATAQATKIYDAVEKNFHSSRSAA